MAVYNGELYVTGSFDSVGAMPTPLRIAKWNGTNWNSISSFPGYGYGGILPSIGGFLFTSGSSTIERWNGINWTAVAPGVSQPTVMCMAEYNGELYVGGQFTFAGGVPANLIAKWNGIQWSAVGGGVTCGCGPINQRVNAMEVYDGELYVGGIFDMAGIIPAHNIARWNGSEWLPVCDPISGPPGGVKAFEVYNEELYVAGSFTSAGGIVAKRIAKWSNPKAVVTPATATVCSNPATLTANSGNYNYQWFLNDNAISGATSQQLIVSASGNYSVVTSVIGQTCAGTATSTYSAITSGAGPTNVSITSSTTVGCQPNTIYVGYGAQSVTLTASGTGAVSYLWSTGATTQSISVIPIAIGTGTYSVTAYDANGCASQQTAQSQITINVIDARCGNDKRKITICHVTDGNVNNRQTICIATTAVTAHLALHSGDCIGACASGLRESLSSEENESEIIIEPNPVSDKLSIITHQLSGKGAIEIYDMLGEKILEQNISSPKTEIDLSSVPDGIYFVRFRSNEQIITRKIFICK